MEFWFFVHLILIFLSCLSVHPSRTLEARKASAPVGSYSAKLFNDPHLLAAKLVEETKELIEARGDPDEVAWETADLIYFAAGLLHHLTILFSNFLSWMMYHLHLVSSILTS
jgi:phosphoribosyl-ATP pyrophosphohydrolase